ncbi:MAG: hypothetical protein PHU63_04125, partial [Candidatus ainarchaeum sp.]|nr:hypothetical protein [Candidatus ainarchaeum sp.]
AEDAINKAMNEGKDVSQAQIKLYQAKDAYELADYELAKSLADESKTLSINAQPKAASPAEELPSEQDEKEQEDFDLVWVIIPILFVLGIFGAYYLFQRK